MMAAALLTATSCSDFDDYNEAQINTEQSANLTLWENIEQNSQLSQFKELIEKAGFADELKGSHYYTVWAPLNNTFDKAAYDTLSKEEIMARFVYNHVADYNHPISGDVINKVFTLNRKTYNFVGNGGSFTFAGVQLAQANIPSANGLIHTMNGAVEFYFNIYDYIMSLQTTDSIGSYFAKYETRELDKVNSVQGPMVNGLQTYVDSVMIIDNSLIRRLRADLQHEDSSYTILLPTNNAWNSSYERINKYYKFIKNTICQDLRAEGNSSSKIATMNTGDINNTLLVDSITKSYIVDGLVYSNNDWYNMPLTGQRPFLPVDSIRTTTRDKLSNPQEIIAQTIGEPIKMSNGWVRHIDSLAFYSWEAYAPEMDIMPANYAGMVLSAASKRTINVKFSDDNFVNKFGDFTETGGNLYFYNIEPSGPKTKPELHMYLPGARSIKYKFYAVFVPGAIIGEDNRPNQVNFTLNYCDANGKLQKYNFSSDLKHDNPKSQKPFVNDTSKVDTMYIGDFEFPVSYANLPPATNGRDVMPDIKISSPMSVFSSSLLATYTRSLRIAAIIMKPVELVEFEEKQK